MASKTAKPNKAVRAIFLRLEITFFARFWVHFLATFWPSFGPPLGVSLGVSWEPSRASWGSLGKPLDPKTPKNFWFFKLFENAAFWLFEAPDGSLGLMLPPLWPIWSQNEPQNVPKNAQKMNQKLSMFFFFNFLEPLFDNMLKLCKITFGTQNGPGFLQKIPKRFTRETKMSPRGPSWALKSQTTAFKKP